MTDHLDFRDVRGQDEAISVLALASTHRYPVILEGPPGVGRTMIARRATTLLDPLTDRERVWLDSVYSDAYQVDRHADTPRRLSRMARPFRAPHHTVSAAAMLGNRQSKVHTIACPSARNVAPFKCTCERETIARPGETHLARFGVLFLDEIEEFARLALEAVRDAMRSMTAGKPWIIVSAMPCPCGWHGAPMPAVDAGKTWRECTCTAGTVDRWRARRAGNLAALGLRDVMTARVRSVSLEMLRGEAPGTPSETWRMVADTANGREVAS